MSNVLDSQHFPLGITCMFLLYLEVVFLSLKLSKRILGGSAHPGGRLLDTVYTSLS